MRNIAKLIFISFIFTIFSISAYSQKIVSAISDRTVSIDSGFTGKTLTLFGNIEPEIGADKPYVEGPFSIIIAISGPVVNRVARKKNRKFGIWLNSEQVVFERLPSFYWLLSNTKLKDSANDKTFSHSNLLPSMQPYLVKTIHSNKLADNEKNTQIFADEMLHILKKDNLYGIDENAIQFRSNTLFSAKLHLPAHVPVGNYLTQTFLLKNGDIIAQKAEGFSVKKTGIEQLLGNSAKNSPFLYGLFSVILALFTGWFGGVVFRR
jgi:uncharacterized protein (TIGR02186 family)